MSTGPVRRSTEALGDDAVTAATGKPRAAWFALLDAEDAAAWSHRDIATWLVERQGVDGWWAQSLTVAYEQERGLRAPGPRADGTYEVSPSRSVGGTLDQVRGLLLDDDARARWLDGALAEVRAGERSVVVGATPRTIALAWPRSRSTWRARPTAPRPARCASPRSSADCARPTTSLPSRRSGPPASQRSPRWSPSASRSGGSWSDLGRNLSGSRCVLRG